MHLLIAWCGFVGAWLLFAGPIYQAATELEEEGFERDAFSAQIDTVEVPERPSPWWWLLPPVGYVLQRRRQTEYRRRIMAVMTQDQLERMVAFANTATGWLFVAGGAFFIALKETWELAEVYELSVLLFVLAVVVMFALCALHTIVRLRGTHQMLARSGTARNRDSMTDEPPATSDA
ncbi:hypothetical protein FHX74_001530 [Friedmanniella endophytica]|uniref:Uncharacterized protein n=1 Tax=Microlunatus kandeliicorticis TaxID=1759536 RepID=A0A7W3IRM2_9ACTN|nr:hypothetical protein [Microlunatus kandeliicorticis]MBA8793925.1 hypothetical protein [Microlunatus kandeliicorticis]